MDPFAALTLAALLFPAPPENGVDLAAEVAKLPALPERDPTVTIDWLVDAVPHRAGAYRTSHPFEIALDNGLVRRTFRLAPNAATIGFDDSTTNTAILRAIEPEATLVLDGETMQVGGLSGAPDRAFLKREWIDSLVADPSAFRFTDFRVGPIAERFPWKRVRHAEDRPWPPPGIALDLEFTAPDGRFEGVCVTVRHEMYDGLPLVSKQVFVRNGSSRAVRIDSFVSERLACVEAESDVEQPWRWEHPNLHVETDYAFSGFRYESCIQTAEFVPDTAYTSQVNYRLQTPTLLLAKPPLGPGVAIAPGETFETFTTWILVNDSTERERRALGRRRMMRTLAPWCTENPLLMHIRSAEPEAVKLALDQCADVGFEMAILTFGSGFDAENEDPTYRARLRELADHARTRGVDFGGYSLLASRSISVEDDVIDPVTGKPGHAKFGASPCLGSTWGIEYFRKLRSLFETTGMNVLEHDGSYPGDVCGSTTHPGHVALADSQWRQWEAIRDFYRECRARGIYLNVPDWYFLSGSSKIGMGYRETNWSLPRDRQLLLARQNLFDGTWEKTPSMGWMFVPLVEYHGGGAAATLEPLSDHLPDYSRHFANLVGYGAQACFRGPRLYDTESTRALVKAWVDFFKAHRRILESDVIHLRRPDGRDLDYVLHVDPRGDERAFLAVWNPTGTRIERELRIPLVYAGLKDHARVTRVDPFVAATGSRSIALDARQHALVAIDVPADGFAFYVFESDSK